MSPLAGTGRAALARPTVGRRERAGAVALLVLVALAISARPAGAQVTGPVFMDGQAQPVFSTVPATWVRQELWVETTIEWLGGLALVVGSIFLIPPVTSLIAGLYLDYIAAEVEKTQYPADPPGCG